MDIRRKFAVEGSITFYGAMAEDQTNFWRSMARHATVWYSDVLDQVAEDVGRVQALVPDEESRSMTRKTKRFNKTFITGSTATDWRWIKTLPETGDLPVRREFPSVAPGGDLMDVGAIPGGMVIALDDDTCFYVYGWNHKVALRSNRKLVTLNKGDIMVYRGDLIFGPTGYDTTNIYLHAYLDTLTSMRPEDHQPALVPTVDDTADPNDDPFCFAWNCTFHSSTPAVRRHLNRFHGFHFHRAPHAMAA